MYLTKNPDWASEREYRFVWIDAEDEPMNDAEAVPIDGCVGGPCLGARFPQVYEVNMRAIKKELGIDAHKIQYVYIQLGIYPAL